MRLTAEEQALRNLLPVYGRASDHGKWHLLTRVTHDHGNLAASAVCEYKLIIESRNARFTNNPNPSEVHSGCKGKA